MKCRVCGPAFGDEPDGRAHEGDKNGDEEKDNER